jgi:hypothetical protein
VRLYKVAMTALSEEEVEERTRLSREDFPIVK